MDQYRLTDKESLIIGQFRNMNREELYDACVTLAGMYSGVVGNRDKAIDMINAILPSRVKITGG